MNAARRKRLQAVIEALAKLRDELETLQEEEQEAFDNLPESVQCSARGDAMEEAVNDIEAAAGAVGEAMDSATSAQGGA